MTRDASLSSAIISVSSDQSLVFIPIVSLFQVNVLGKTKKNLCVVSANITAKCEVNLVRGAVLYKAGVQIYWQVKG